MRVASVLAVVVAFGLNACGSDEGAGPSSSKCSQGDTRTCAGPGACSGAQSCDANGAWSACDCGGSGGAAGTGGSAGSSGSGGSGNASGSAGADAGTQCPTGLPGPELVLVPTLAGGHYCIDSTEVTQAQYQAFLSTNPSTAGQKAECAANTQFVPEAQGACTDYTGLFDPTGSADKPVVCVSWCDAIAYCAWAGKRLCGRVGAGAADPSKLADANESQWFNACSKGGTLAYPYGPAFDQTACPVNQASGPPLPVKSNAACVGGYPGLHDMSGNVDEWEDACEGDKCPVRGGSMVLGAEAGACSWKYLVPRVAHDGFTGFRCCADLG